MSIFVDRALETSTTTGTGSFTVSGAVTGFQSLNSAVGTNAFFDYCIEAVDGSGVPTGEWEVGRGYLSAATTLVRDVPYTGSAATPVSFSAGTKRVFLTFGARSVASFGAAAAAYFAPVMA